MLAVAGVAGCSLVVLAWRPRTGCSVGWARSLRGLGRSLVGFTYGRDVMPDRLTLLRLPTLRGDRVSVHGRRE